MLVRFPKYAAVSKPEGITGQKASSTSRILNSSLHIVTREKAQKCRSAGEGLIFRWYSLIPPLLINFSLAFYFEERTVEGQRCG